MTTKFNKKIDSETQNGKYYVPNQAELADKIDELIDEVNYLKQRVLDLEGI